MFLSPILDVHPLLFNVMLALASLVIVAKSADLLVYGISDYAKKLGLSDYLIGFLVISIGTALPELIASINGALMGQGGLVFGTIIGSNLFKIPLLGLILVIAKKIKTKTDAAGNAPIITFMLIILPLMLVMDGSLSRVDGIMLVFAFFVYILRLWKGEGQLGRIKKNVKLKNIYKDGLIFIGSLIALLLSARWLVFSSLEISKIMDISPFIIGFVVIGIGASTPEFMVQVRSVLRKKQDIVLGNVFGSLVANSALVLGITALIAPFSISFGTIMNVALFMTAGVLFILFLTGRESVNWKHGLVMIGIYAAALLFEFLV